MTGTTITTSTTVGVSLTAASQNPVTIAPSGTVNLAGSYASAIYAALGVPSTLANDGVLQAADGYGVRFRAGGTITNGSASDTKASISGGVNGVQFDIHGTGKLSNFGTIRSTGTGSGIYGLSTDNIANGSTSDGVALIAGYQTGISMNGLTATIANFGMISASGTSSTGIYFRQGGVVTNGDATHTAASVTGVQFGINMAHNEGTVRNFGTIAGSGPQGRGVNLNAGGTVVNGSNSDTAAYILAAGPRTAVYIGGSAGSVTNFGTIKSAGRTGVVLDPGGTVTNGSAMDTKALISGARSGIYMRADAASAVVNFGTISGAQKSGVNIYQDGQITNGSTADTVALIAGGNGIYLGSGTIVNFGTVTGSLSSGISIGESALISNGDATHKNALISSTVTTSQHSALSVNLGAATINNFGTIKSASASAIHLNNGGTIANGSTADTTALLQGGTTGSSVYVLTGQTTINNFGTIGNSASGGGAIFLGGGGTSIVNGSSASTKAAIKGIFVQAGSVSVVNFAQIIGTGILISSGSLGVSNFGTVSSSNTGIDFGSNGTVKATGTVVNGSTAVTTSLITGSSNGIFANGSIGVTNFASITANTFDGINLGGGGSIANGSAADTKASIIGGAGTSGSGIFVNAGAATVTNFATIRSGGSGMGFGNNGTVGSSGTVVNGSSAVTTAKIIGGSGTTGTGIFINSGSLGVSNFGTVSGGNTGINFGSNGTVKATGTVVNGSTAVTTSLITGSSNGIFANGSIGVTNFASITANTFDGINLGGGGSIANGSAADTKASIIGGSGTSGSGIFVSAGAATVTNLATISGGGSGVGFGNNGTVGSSGTVVNGSSAVTTAKIIGGSGTTGTGIFINSGSLGVSNFGTVSGGNTGINFGSNGTVKATGTVVNGSTAVTTSLITGSSNGIFANGSIGVTNFASITANTFDGINLGGGGSIANGSAADTKASIIGGSGTSGSGVFVSAGAATVTNLATIIGGGSGVGFGSGTVGSSGTVVNGSSAVTTAKIIGGSGTVGAGIFISTGSVAVTNFATIVGAGDGINFGANGTSVATGRVVNGSTSDTTATITGYFAGVSAGGAVPITNFAVIKGTNTGVFLNSGGSVTNGNANDEQASIIGGSGTIGNGIFVNSGTANISNFGTIGTGGTGVNLGTNGTTSSTGTVVNGSATDTKALITGSFSAIFASGGQVKVTNFGTLSGNTAIGLTNGTTSSADTVENFGSIVSNFGTGGTAIQFGDQADRLILHPGASIVGKVFGGAGSNTLELASGGAGTVGSIGTNFMGFTALAVDGGTTWTLTGNNAIGTVTDNGSLTLAPSASLDVTTAVDPASTGIFKLDASSLLEVLADKGTSNKIQFVGTGELLVDKAANFGTNVGKTTYNGPLIQSFTTGDKIDLKDVAAGATLNYTAATGLLQISNAATAVATLKFDNATLGFHGTDDGTGHLLITHS